MNFFQIVTEIFVFDSTFELVHIEKFTSYEIKCNISNFISFNINKISSDLIPEIGSEDYYEIKLKIADNLPIILRKDNFKEFQQNIIEERIDIDDELVMLEINIVKSTKKAINVYDFKCFEAFWKYTPTYNILKLLKTYKNDDHQNHFILKENEVSEFNSFNIFFQHSYQTKKTSHFSDISIDCYFSNNMEFPFNAYYFKVENTNDKNGIIDKLDRLNLLFSIISIFDISSIEENVFSYKLNGFKSFYGEIDIDRLELKYQKNYFDIFSWIYSESEKISDKLGLSRNIISLSLKSNTIDIPDNTLFSIQSGYRVYLQDNLYKYIELRNKILDELSWISQKSSEIISNYLSNYQKSIFTFISFFISVFLLRFLKDNRETSVFSREETIFSLFFLLLSIVFMLFSIWIVNQEKNRIQKKYINVKKRYLDLLIESDIEKILKNDEEFNYEMSYIRIRRNNYTFLWSITIIIFVIAIFNVSSYLNFNLIINSFLNELKFMINKK